MSLGGSKINDMCANLIAQFFTSNPLFKIIHLQLMDCSITDKGMKLIVNALKSERFIEVLKL